jgi:hypothetical protein
VRDGVVIDVRSETLSGSPVPVEWSPPTEPQGVVAVPTPRETDSISGPVDQRIRPGGPCAAAWVLIALRSVAMACASASAVPEDLSMSRLARLEPGEEKWPWSGEGQTFIQRRFCLRSSLFQALKKWGRVSEAVISWRSKSRPAAKLNGASLGFSATIRRISWQATIAS